MSSDRSSGGPSSEEEAHRTAWLRQHQPELRRDQVSQIEFDSEPLNALRPLQENAHAADEMGNSVHAPFRVLMEDDIQKLVEEHDPSFEAELSIIPPPAPLNDMATQVSMMEKRFRRRPSAASVRSASGSPSAADGFDSFMDPLSAASRPSATEAGTGAAEFVVEDEETEERATNDDDDGIAPLLRELEVQTDASVISEKDALISRSWTMAMPLRARRLYSIEGRRDKTLFSAMPSLFAADLISDLMGKPSESGAAAESAAKYEDITDPSGIDFAAYDETHALQTVEEPSTPELAMHPSPSVSSPLKDFACAQLVPTETDFILLEKIRRYEGLQQQLQEPPSSSGLSFAESLRSGEAASIDAQPQPEEDIRAAMTAMEDAELETGSNAPLENIYYEILRCFIQTASVRSVETVRCLLDGAAEFLGRRDANDDASRIRLIYEVVVADSDMSERSAIDLFVHRLGFDVVDVDSDTLGRMNDPSTGETFAGCKVYTLAYRHSGLPPVLYDTRQMEVLPPQRAATASVYSNGPDVTKKEDAVPSSSSFFSSG